MTTNKGDATPDAKPALTQVLAELYDRIARDPRSSGREANAVQAAYMLLTGRKDEGVVSLFDLSALTAPALAPEDPLDTPLPCRVDLGGMSFGKGVKLRSLVDAAKRWREDAYGPRPTDEQAAHNLAVLQGRAPVQPAEGAPTMEQALFFSVWWPHNRAKFTTPRQAAMAAVKDFVASRGAPQPEPPSAETALKAAPVARVKMNSRNCPDEIDMLKRLPAGEHLLYASPLGAPEGWKP